MKKLAGRAKDFEDIAALEAIAKRGRDMSEEDWGTWDAKRTRSQTVGLQVSAEERLEWVEEMLELATAAGALPKLRDEWGSDRNSHWEGG